MAQFDQLINEAQKIKRNAEKPTASKTQPAKTPAAEKEVNLGIKIPESHRAYWTGQAKMNRVTIKQVLIEALIERFGEPPT